MSSKPWYYKVLSFYSYPHANVDKIVYDFWGIYG